MADHKQIERALKSLKGVTQRLIGRLKSLGRLTSAPWPSGKRWRIIMHDKHGTLVQLRPGTLMTDHIQAEIAANVNGASKQSANPCWN